VLTHFAAALQDVEKLAVKRTPAEITAILREYKQLMHEAVEAEQGFVERIVGDQFISVWGGLVSQTPAQAAIHACNAALRQLRALEAYNARSGLELRLNIGIASGEPELSVSLCQLCPSRRAVILVSQSTRELCPQTLRFEELLPLPREDRSVRVFELKPA
jgi:class 3 adenylate cyclase